jgi:hypothetical protein
MLAFKNGLDHIAQVLMDLAYKYCLHPLLKCRTQAAYKINTDKDFEPPWGWSRKNKQKVAVRNNLLFTLS